MYRIILDPRTSQWVIQLSIWGFFWTVLRTQISGPGTPVSIPRQFARFADAERFANEIGLSSAYDYHTRGKHHASAPA